LAKYQGKYLCSSSKLAASILLSVTVARMHSSFHQNLAGGSIWCNMVFTRNVIRRLMTAMMIKNNNKNLVDKALHAPPSVSHVRKLMTKGEEIK
jgi:hypothetical protein